MLALGFYQLVETKFITCVLKVSMYADCLFHFDMTFTGVKQLGAGLVLGRLKFSFFISDYVIHFSVLMQCDVIKHLFYAF